METFDLIKSIRFADLVRYPSLVGVNDDADKAVRSQNQFITQRKCISFIRRMMLLQFNCVPLNLAYPGIASPRLLQSMHTHICSG